MPSPRVFHLGLPSLVVFVVFALSGCALPAPVIPENVYEDVRSDNRERNYDLAWQEIRMLNALLEAENDERVQENVVWVLARMHRLEQGRAGRLGDIFTAQSMALFADNAGEQEPDSNRTRMRELGLELQDYFDAGDFSAAKEAALELLVLVNLSARTPER
jgi:hypothetical protein